MTNFDFNVPPSQYGFLGDAFPEIGDALYDPFEKAPQSQRTLAFCLIVIGGVSIFSATNPYLISVHITNGWGGAYNCEMQFDDRYGELPIPTIDVPVNVYLGWQSESLLQAFTGLVSNVEHMFARDQGGRRMWIRANGYGWAALYKQLTQYVNGSGAPPGTQFGPGVSLGTVIADLAGRAGMTAQIHPTLSALMRDHWEVGGASPLHAIAGFADELGALTRAEGGTTVIFTVPGAFPNGLLLPVIPCQWGNNLISYQVIPAEARSMWAGAYQQWFNTQTANWLSTSRGFNQPAPWNAATAYFKPPAPAPNEVVAQQQVDGAARKQSMLSGTGSITINGEPIAAANGTAQIMGVRDGVDGSYLIQAAHHMWSRQGYTTRLVVSPNGQTIGPTSVAGGYHQPPLGTTNSSSNLPADYPGGEPDSVDNPTGLT